MEDSHRRSLPPDDESLALFRLYVGNWTEKRIRAALKLRRYFESWAVEIYQGALAKKLEEKREVHRQQQFERQMGAPRDEQGRYTGRDR